MTYKINITRSEHLAISPGYGSIGILPSPYQKILHPLNNRGIGVFDEDDFEEEEILIPK